MFYNILYYYIIFVSILYVGGLCELLPLAILLMLIQLKQEDCKIFKSEQFAHIE